MTEPSSVPRLAEVLTEDMIMVRADVSDWKDAIRKSGELLVKAGAADPKYIDAMIKFCEEHNAYIVIAPGIAIPHARPEDGMKKVGFSLITLKKPVEFGNPGNDPVNLVIALGAPDNKSHIKALAQLAEILMNKEAVKRIRDARTKSEILEALNPS